MENIDNAEAVKSLNSQIKNGIIKNTMLFVMRSHITPLWEDPNNRKGGCFSFKVLNRQVSDIWKNLLCALCGETLCIDNTKNEHINGITISPKKNFCIVKVWMNCCNIQDPNFIIDIPNLSKNGCIFKRHEPEF
tara:strand:+ start:916 stop:1317 length:402 start_codon:yes stop_codon:yes gene_type:complete